MGHKRTHALQHSKYRPLQGPDGMSRVGLDQLYGRNYCCRREAVGADPINTVAKIAVALDHRQSERRELVKRKPGLGDERRAAPVRDQAGRVVEEIDV